MKLSAKATEQKSPSGQFFEQDHSHFEATAGFALVELVRNDTSRGSRGHNSVTPSALQSNHTVGEIVYAYVVCRVDVSFAVASLSRFSSAPHIDHYMALKNVIRHLRRTKDWGLVFW